MTISQRICQVFAAIVFTVAITGTLVECSGMAGKVAVALVGG